jgi:hypothetical protein
LVLARFLKEKVFGDYLLAHVVGMEACYILQAQMASALEAIVQRDH